MFNGNLSLQEGIEQIQDAYVHDFDSILPLYVYPKDTNESAAIKALMVRATEKGEKAIRRHSMYIKKEERNKFIDEAYMLIGKSQMYILNFAKANEMFEYVARAYKKKPEGKIAQLWHAKSLLNEHDNQEAYDRLKKLHEDKDFPKNALFELHKTTAHYHLKEGDYQKAIESLQSSLKFQKKKQEKIKINYTIANLYDANKDFSSGQSYYQEVLKLKPHYEMMLNSKLKLALGSAKNGLNSKEELKSLLKKAPSGNQKAKILIALAEVSLKNKEMKSAQNYASKAVSEATENKIKSKAYLLLGDYYYDNKAYAEAKVYYDSTLQTSDPSVGNFESISERRNNLGRLVANQLIISREDSLLRLSQMSEGQRREHIEAQIEKNKKLALEKEEKEKIAALQKADDVPSSSNITASINNKGNWYFENPSTMLFGEKEFKKIWDDRKLEDHWRRKDKSSNAFSDIGSDTEISEENIENIEAYLKDIPLDETSKQASYKKIIDAHYDLGIVYSEKLSEAQLAIDKGFDPVVSDYDTSSKAAPSAYFCYRLYKELNAPSKAETYKMFLLQKYPHSEYAAIVKDPEYFSKKQQAQNMVRPAYEKAYNYYINKDYAASLGVLSETQNKYDLADIAPKFLLLKAYNFKETFNKAGFESALKNITTNYPKSEQADLANQLLKKSNKFFAVQKPKKVGFLPSDTMFNFSDSTDFFLAYAFTNSNDSLIKSFVESSEQFLKKEADWSFLTVDFVSYQVGQYIVLFKVFKSANQINDCRQKINQQPFALAQSLQTKMSFPITQENLEQMIVSKSLTRYNTLQNKVYSK